MIKQPFCRECGDPIKWVYTPSGKRLALEASPDPKGRVMLDRRWDYDHGTKRTVGIQLDVHDAEEARAAGKLLWIPHAVHCSANRAKAPIPDSVRAWLRSEG